MVGRSSNGWKNALCSQIMKKEISILAFYGLIAVCALIALAIIIIGLNFLDAYENFQEHCADVRQRYINDQKQMIKHEVERIVQTINAERTRIGTTGVDDFVDDKEDQLKKNFLERIARIRFGPEQKGYIFVVSYDGIGIMCDVQQDLVGKNIWEVTDPDGIKVTQEERKAAEKPQGDFIYYSWPKAPTEMVAKKVTFVKGIPAWEWIIGAGVYLDDVENEIAALQANMYALLKKSIRNSILAVVGVFLLLVLMYKWLSRKLKKDVDVFVNFFEQAARSDEPIDINRVRFSEFRKLAGYANEMVSERCLAEEALRKNNEQLELVVKGSNIGWWDWDMPSGNEIYNEILPELLGYHLDEITPHIDWWEGKIHPDDLEKIGTDLQDHFDGKTDFYMNEHRLLTKSGEWRWFADHGKVVKREHDGTPVRMIGTLRDITTRKLAEQELQQVERLRSVGTLAGGIAHDFNNFLMGLFGNISMAKEDLPEGHSSLEFLKQAEKCMNRATRLTNRLLTFAKGSEPIREQVSLTSLVEEVISFDLSGSNVKPIFEQAENLWLADVDPGQIQEVFSNLTINADQAMPDGGHLYITMNNMDVTEETMPGLNPGKYIQIIVRDEGTGISQKHLHRIFEPYYTTKQTGSGLGLAASYSIITKHGGYISAESDIAKGTTFTLYLPALEEPQHQEMEQKEPDHQCLKKPARILVMDDDEMVSRIFKVSLERNGFNVENATNGQQTLEMYKQAMDEGNPFDAVIMDLTIPGGMGGEEAIKELLKMNSEACAIVSSGYADDPVMANYGDYGFKGGVVKPCSVKKLLEVVHQVLG